MRPTVHQPSRLLAIVFVSALLMGIALLAAPAQATFAGGIGKLAFQGNRDGNLEIYTINANGTGMTRITNNAAGDTEPSWSPDGQKIAFASDRDGNLEIYVMNADGSGQTRLTNNAAFDELPGWSPDGTKIVFDSGRNDPPGQIRGEIFTMNADGSGQTRLTNDPGYDFAGDWSPDGTKIAWMSTRTGSSDIWTMNTDGTAPANLTPYPTTAENFPSWSPDGTKIAFDETDGSVRETKVMNADGSGAVYLWIGWGATWRPDGQKVAWAEGFTMTDTDIVQADYPDQGGPNSTNITNETSPNYASYPDWQPLNNNYARPQAGTPMRIPIVPDYKKCTTAQTTHRGALSAPSCYSPTPESSYLTIGSPEYNGAPANSSGFVRFKATPDDGTITVNLTDVRCRGTSGGCSNGALSDYSGHLLFAANFRVTDKNNGPTGVGLSRNGTVQDLQITFPVPCQTTPVTTIGSTCSTTTTLDTVLGGSTVITNGKRAIWQLIGLPGSGRVIELDDGGADGIATTFDNTAFAAGGLFFP